jgi:hypothetical protein
MDHPIAAFSQPTREAMIRIWTIPIEKKDFSIVAMVWRSRIHHRRRIWAVVHSYLFMGLESAQISN